MLLAVLTLQMANGRSDPNYFHWDCDSLSLAQGLKSATDSYYAESYKEARRMFQDLIPCARRLDNKAALAEALKRMGQLVLLQDEPLDLATKNFLEALSLFEVLKDEAGAASANLQLGVVDFSMENYPAAVLHFEAILSKGEKAIRIQPITQYLLALCFTELARFDEAEKMFSKAKTGRPQSDTLFHLQLESQYGKYLLKRGLDSAALKHLKWVEETYYDMIQESDFSPTSAFLGSTYLAFGDYQSAIQRANMARRFADGSGSQTLYYREALEVLHQAYAKMGPVDSAYCYLKILTEFKERIESEQVQRRVTQMIGQYAFEREMKEREAAEQIRMEVAEAQLARRSLQRNVFLFGFIFLLLATALFLKQRQRIAKSKKRSEDLLLNILPQEIVEELKLNGEVKAQEFNDVSVLFTDFKGFTASASRLSPAILVRELNSCFEAFDQIMDKYQLEKIKTIGDAYMAAGGLHRPRTSETKDVVLAALEMQEFVEFRKKLASLRREDAFFDMRVGIHTGTVVAGIVGLKKFQYDIWGDTVNIASRMESAGEVARVNISESTYKQIHQETGFQFTSRGEIAVKGKGLLKMWFVNKAEAQKNPNDYR